MTFQEYQQWSRKTAIYWDLGKNLVYPTLGLAGEVGEVAEKIKKIFRDDNGIISDEKRIEIQKELGDVLWYVSQLASEMGLSLEDVVKTTVFLVDLADFAEVNRVYASYFSNEPPARSVVQVVALPKGSRLEMEVVAVKPV